MVQSEKSNCFSISHPEFVRFQTEDKMILQALLWRPNEDLKTVVLYVPSATGGFAGAHDLTPIAKAITDKGYAFMAMNARTIGIPDGWVFARFEDCVLDVDAAIKCAKSRGFEDVILVGHSLGGPRTMYYWTQKKEPSVRALVFMGTIVSPYGEGQFRFSEEKKAEYAAFLGKARELIRRGLGNETMTYPEYFAAPVPPNLTMSARTLVNFFGTPDESNACTAKFGDKVTVPALVVHSKFDTIAIPKNAEEIYASLTSAPRRDLVWVTGGHMLDDPEASRSYGEAIAAWLADVVPPTH